MSARPGVTAVLVASDGARWLPEALAALSVQTRRPDRFVGVDVGSADDSAALVRASAGTVLLLPNGTSYADAVAAGLATAEPTSWVWLLHDDAAPAPDCLERLLDHAADSPSAGVLGPKVLDWHDPRTLLEIGVTTDASGRRVTGLERGEQDQGQHDRPRDVLAVSTAGALVRRDVWDALGGLDPELPLRADLDLGWRASAAGHRVVVVPGAAVRHARAAPERPYPRLGAVDRRDGLRLLLAHAAGPRLALVLPRVVLGALLRTLLLLLRRRPRAAVEELVALGQVLGRPGWLRAARRRRAASRAVPPGALRPLRPSPAERLRARLTGLGDRTGPGPRPPWWRGPAVRLTAGLALLALLAQRDLLVGGALQGGRLLPAPAGASDLWSAFAEPGGEPRLALLAALATGLLGRAPTAVSLVLLASVPLAGLAAWSAAGRVVRAPLLRAWLAATWALLPVGTGAVAAGRLDGAVAQVGLPLLLAGGWAVLSRDPRTAGWHRAWALGLGLAVVTAFAPQLWPLLTVLLLGTALLVAALDRGPAARRRAVASAVAVVVPVLLLLPWTWLDDPLHGPGRLAPGLARRDLPAWDLLLLSPGGPGVPALLLTAGVLLGALGGLLRTGRPRVAAGGWAVALVALAYALLLARTETAGQPVWPGVGLQVAAAGLLLAAAVGADGLGGRLERAAFGWRQLLAVAVVAATAAVPALCAASWVVRGADGPLQRGGGTALPAFVRADLAADGVRALVLRARADGTVGYALTGPDGQRLGEPRRRDEVLGGTVADLLAVRGSDAATALATRGVRWVAADEQLAPVLDAQAGLLREGDLWRVAAATGPRQLLTPGAARTAVGGARSAPGTVPLDGPVPPGDPGRLLVLAEPAGAGWHAELAGRRLPERTAWGWAQGFEVPAAGGDVRVVRDGSAGRVAAQALGLLVVGVLAAPARREQRL